MMTKAPRFDGFKPASEASSRTKSHTPSTNTRPELLLRKELWRRGHRYRLHRAGIPGRPDFVFVREQLAVFCDGDFWHGRDWGVRKQKLRDGSNPEYWIKKIEYNMERDRRQEQALRAEGWTVVRLWSTDITADPIGAADYVEHVLLRLRASEAKQLS